MLNRRDFVKGAALSAVTLAGAGMLAGCAAEEAPADVSQDVPSEPEGQDAVATPKANRVCELLGIEKPVIQASMSNLTSAELVAAVSNAGGLGVLGTGANQTPSSDDPIEILREEIQKTKALTDKPFGVNWSGPDYLDMLHEEGISIVYVLGMGSVDNGYAVDTDTIALLKDEGMTVLFRDVNCTVDAMVAAQNAGADIVIASGYGNGGHMGETRVTLPSILAEAQGKITVPLMVSGGIATGSVAAAYAAMGAEGCWCGTRFLTTEESPCSDAAKQVIIDAKAEELVEFRGVLGFVHTTRTPFSENMVALSDAGTSRMELAGMYTPIFLAMRTGEIDGLAVNMSDCVNSITSIKTCKEVVDELGAPFLQ